MYGYQLRAAFEEATGAHWPLNIGQVYTTLARLERDGLVRPWRGHDGGQRPYELTGAGLAALSSWFASPVRRSDRPRDELAVKLALALATPGVDVPALVRRQRAATMASLQEYARTKVRADRPDRLACQLTLDAMVFQAEAELRWLDHCLARLQLNRATGAAAAAPDPASHPPAGPEAASTDPPGPDPVGDPDQVTPTPITAPIR
jgi:DNA-binding PadR family transcriptional regulator